MSIYDLPNIDFLPVDADVIKNNIITVYESIAGKKLFPGDPVRLFLLTQADIIIQQRLLINDAARQNLLRYARDRYLDHLGAMVGTARLPASAAITTVRFTLSTIRPEVITIPVGTRVTPGDNLFFATTQVTEIPAGATEVDVVCECLQTGITGNGFLPGQINILVDPLPYVSIVTNLTDSAGGTDVEEDNPYRERIHASPERFSVAGPAGAYEYWARTAHPGISDVKVFSPAATEVNVLVLMANGGLPTQDILDAVDDVVNDRSVRPLTDMVTVSAPTVVNYSIDLSYWIDVDKSADAVSIQASVSQAINDYVSWQKAKIGRNINPSELTKLVMMAGARRVEVASPTYTVLNDTQIAIIADPDNDITVTYGGIEDD